MLFYLLELTMTRFSNIADSLVFDWQIVLSIIAKLPVGLYPSVIWSLPFSIPSF